MGGRNTDAGLHDRSQSTGTRQRDSSRNPDADRRGSGTRAELAVPQRVPGDRTGPGDAVSQDRPERVGHHLLRVRAADKRAVLTEIAARPGRTLLFGRTQYGVDKLARRLRESGVAAVALHGGLSQSQRNRTLAAFADGTAPVLVATDVAARGIHVDDITLVVHADPAADAKDYLHRSGRTGRAGAAGTVVTLVTDTSDEAAAVLRAAGVHAREIAVRPGDPGLTALTGARRPTGRPAANPITPTPAAVPDTPGNSRKHTRRPHNPARRSKRRAN
ncbi:C-terminal helicase domain-containing protein [Nocardia nova]|uniref:C-terminal helicase domain-containing protein n=1 Tax=Nocardia nova TaxID=37330 RepID=UPI0033E83003